MCDNSSNPSECIVVEKLSMEYISYELFCDRYLARNVPVILTDALQSMPYFKSWQRNDGSLDLDFLSSSFGNHSVPVVGNFHKYPTDFDPPKNNFIKYYSSLPLRIYMISILISALVCDNNFTRFFYNFR